MTTEKQILNFIDENFKNGRKNLLPKINEFLLDQNSTIILNADFKNKIKLPFHSESFSSVEIRNSKTNKGEIGDISDIWIFCLNQDVFETYNNGNIDWDFSSYLKKGKELHICKLWVNWFLPVYYLETCYEFIDNKNGFEQFGTLTLNEANEIKIVKNIMGILEKRNYTRLGLNFLNTKLKGISTDCSEFKNASIFDCLFSDIVYPTEHVRKSIPKKKESVYPEFSFKEFLNDNRERTHLEAEICQDYNTLSLKFDNANKIVESISRGKLNGTKYKAIKIRYK